MDPPGDDSAPSAPDFVGSSDLLAEAFETAQAAHADQIRPSNGSPYLIHPLRVAEALHSRGARSAVVAAALLHDTVEDSDLSVGQIVERFGIEIGELVGALTEDPEIENWAERKDALRAQVEDAGVDAAAIYAADKLANLREMRGLYARDGEDAIDLHKAPSLDLRVGAWRRDARMVAALAPGLEVVEEMAAELRAFESQRAGNLARGAAAVGL